MQADSVQRWMHASILTARCMQPAALRRYLPQWSVGFHYKRRRRPAARPAAAGATTAPLAASQPAAAASIGHLPPPRHRR